MTSPHPLEKLQELLVGALLPPAAAAQFKTGDIGHAALQPAATVIGELSERYVQRRGIAIHSIEEASAYALYYTPINAAKVLHLLAEASVAPPARPLRVLDFGCGPATAALAAAAYFADMPLEVTAVDVAGPMRTTASLLLTALARERPLTWTIGSDFSGAFDLIIAANVLNEVDDAHAAALLDRFADALLPGGRLIVLEPALLETTRTSMARRDGLLARRPDITPLFPCTRRDACPMLTASKSDWCHAPLLWEEPRLVRQIDRLTGFNKHRTKYGAFIFARDAALRSGLRIVGTVEKSRRGAEALGCGADFYGALVLPKRHRSDTNRVFEKLRPFDRVEITPPPLDGEISREAHVRLVRE